MKTLTTSRGFGKLTGIGSLNTKNRIQPKTTRSHRVEVMIEQEGVNKAASVQVIVPVSRSSKGSRRVARITWNGYQAREVYETLRKFFELDNQNISTEDRG